MKRFITAAAAVALLAGCSASEPTDPATQPPVTIEEDDPNWDCTTMGNQTCGPDWSQPAPRDVCVETWDAYVDEWNVLVEERDAAGALNVVVDGVEYETFEDYAAAMGWPTTFEQHVAASPDCAAPEAPR